MLDRTQYTCVSIHSHVYRPLSVGGNAVELEDRTMGCSLHDNRLHCSMAIFFCPVLQFRGFDVTSERGLYRALYPGGGGGGGGGQEKQLRLLCNHP